MGPSGSTIKPSCSCTQEEFMIERLLGRPSGAPWSAGQARLLSRTFMSSVTWPLYPLQPLLSKSPPCTNHGGSLAILQTYLLALVCAPFCPECPVPSLKFTTFVGGIQSSLLYEVFPDHQDRGRGFPFWLPST